MKNKKWAPLLVMTIFCHFAMAQDYAFQVMINKGNNEVKSGDSWQPVKTGATLKTTDEIKLEPNAYLGLRHTTGKMLELKNQGTHKVADLAKNVGTGSSVMNKYTDFILSSNSAEAKKNRLSATGAVHRTRGTGDGAIDLLLPENQFSRVYGDQVIINWESEKVQGPYVIELQNMFEDVLAKYETDAKSYTINLTEPNLSDKDLNAIMVRVSSKNDPKQTSSIKMIQKLSADDYNKVKTDLTELGPVLDETAINKYFLANFFEKNNLLVDAITAYKQAIALEPSFEAEFEEFMYRKNLKQPKQN